MAGPKWGRAIKEIWKVCQEPDHKGPHGPGWEWIQNGPRIGLDSRDYLVCLSYIRNEETEPWEVTFLSLHLHQSTIVTLWGFPTGSPCHLPLNSSWRLRKWDSWCHQTRKCPVFKAGHNHLVFLTHILQQLEDQGGKVNLVESFFYRARWFEHLLLIKN